MTSRLGTGKLLTFFPVNTALPGSILTADTIVFDDFESHAIQNTPWSGT